MFDQFTAVGARAASSSATVVDNLALRQTAIRINTSGIHITAGTLFSISNRLHAVKEVTNITPFIPYENPISTGGPWDDDQPWTDRNSTSANYSITIIPPLRTSYSPGQTRNFEDVQVRCVIDDVNSDDLEIEPGRYGFADLAFVESI